MSVKLGMGAGVALKKFPINEERTNKQIIIQYGGSNRIDLLIKKLVMKGKERTWF